jgi:DNA-binding NarL/FixJ family response regulator
MDLWVAGRCAATDPNLLQMVEALRPDVITVEVASFGDRVGGMIRQLADAQPRARVLVLSSDHDVRHAVEAARAGAAAWIAKEQGTADLERVLRGVLKGEAWFPPDMLGEILRELRADVGRAREKDSLLRLLSDREKEVLVAMMDGQHCRQIARALSISAETVRTHIRNVFVKLDVHSRLEAVRVARAAGLEPVPAQA